MSLNFDLLKKGRDNSSFKAEFQKIFQKMKIKL